MTRQFRTLPVFGADEREVSEVVRGIMDGKTNNTGTIDLAAAGASTTTIYDDRIGYDSIILLMPVNSAAATAYPPYGAFQDNTTQTIASTTVAYAMKLDVTDYALGVSVSNSSRIKVDYSGLYNIQFSAQFTNTDSQIQDISIWFRKNGTDVAASNSEFNISNKHGSINGTLIAALNFFLPMAKDDYVEIMWKASNTAVKLETIAAQTSPTRPSTPSVIATIQHVSSNGYTTNTFTEPYILSKARGSAVISHPANAVSGRKYGYIVVG
jgi:hypothetical protein